MSIDDQSLIGTMLPTVHFQKIILESGGDTNPMVSDDPHIMDKSHTDESNFMSAIAIDQIGNDPTGQIQNPKTWDATADINDEADTMTTTLNLILKDKIDTLSQNTMWMFNNLFLDHVKLLVVQMSHSEYATSEAYLPSKFYESRIYKWLAQYNKKPYDLSKDELTGWKTFNNTKPQSSNIEDYEVKEFTLREVIEKGIPKYLDILKENPDSPTDITDTEVQKKIITYLLEGNTSLNYSESRPAQIETYSADNEKVINIPFQIEFTLKREKPLGLSYLAFTYFDFDLETLQDKSNNFPDIAFDAFGIPHYDMYGYMYYLEPKYPTLKSTTNVKEVIKDGNINKTDVVFLLDNGQEYFGNVKMTDPASQLAINSSTAKPFLDNGYNENPGDYTLLKGVTFYTDNQYTGPGGYNTPFAAIQEGDQILRLVKRTESIIHDFRIFKQLEQIQIQFENFSNNLKSLNELHAYNQNIVLKDKSVFTDAWLTLTTLESAGADFVRSNFLFGVDAGALLEKESLFSWFYQTDTDITGIYPATQGLIDSIYSNIKIKNIKIIRRAVKELNLNPDFAKDRFEPYLGEDPDPHISGYTKQVANMAGHQVYKNFAEEISHQKISEGGNFTLNFAATSTTSQAAGGLSITDPNNISFQVLSRRFLNSLNMPFSQEKRVFFIRGEDRTFPAKADKRFQYGVKFEIEDGVRPALKNFLTHLVESRKLLSAIEDDIKVMIYSDGYSNFPIVDFKTGLFVPEYNSLQSTNKFLKQATQESLDIAIDRYLTLIALFSFDTEYVQDSGGSFLNSTVKIVNKLSNNITLQQKNDILKAISPYHLGSAKLFLKFTKVYDDLIASMRALLKEKKSLQSSIGSNEGNNVVTTDIVGYEPKKNLIEVEQYFPQTLYSPTNGLTGYDYLTPGELMSSGYAGDETGGGNPSLNPSYNVVKMIFEKIVNRNCFKYFAFDTVQDIPQLPPGSAKSFNFRTPDHSKYNFLTPTRVKVDGANYNLMPNYTEPDSDNPTPFGGFDTTNINYSNAMLHVLARTETSKAEYPQVISSPGSAYNQNYDMEDSYIIEQIMAAQSCTVEGRAASVYGYEDMISDPNHAPAYIYLPLYEGAEKINDLGIVDENTMAEVISPAIDNYQQNLVTTSNLLMHLIASDEFRYMYNINPANFLIKTEPSTTPSNDNLLEQLRMKYDPTQSGFTTDNFSTLISNKIPNPIKYMFMVANYTANTEFSYSHLNPYFLNILLSFLSGVAIEETAYAGTKEAISLLYFNFFNHVRVQYLSGFGVTESGKISFKDPIWQDFSVGGASEPVPFEVGNGPRNILCRLIPYDDSELINSQTKYLDLPILNRYFILNVS